MGDARRISPAPEDWDSLRQPLTEGEREVADLLRTHLAIEWEIYLQPHLNGLMPDFVLLHPHRGIVVLEVKDWSGAGPDTRSFRVAIDTSHIRREEIAELYCPDLGYRYRGRVAHRFIFPYLRRDALRRLTDGLASWSPADFVTSEDIPDRIAENIESALPRTGIEEVTAAISDLRRWFTEPEFSREQRRPLRLDARQLRLVRQVPARRVIQGPAGSGKSQVLAARAAELARDGRRVLVLTYNITLLNYLRDLAVRWPDPRLPSRPIRDNVVWLNFHQWCKRICIGGGMGDEYSSLWHSREEALESGVAALTARAIEEGGEALDSFDAILVDEAQDFARSWLESLQGALREGGQWWTAVDLTQDIYRRGEAWPTGLFDGLGFRRPARLEGSHRMHPRVCEMMARFAREYLGNTNVASPESTNELILDLDLGEPFLKWVQLRPEADLVEVLFRELWGLLPRVDDPAIAELVFLCSTHKLGLAVVKRLEESGVHVRHTFDANGKPPRSQKMAFFKGDARVKGTTIHSFKGWESRLLLVHVGRGQSEDARRAVYTGLTRLLKSPSGSALTVVSEAPDLGPFGESWPKYDLV